jgi:sn-glycerol 3-phosphate transport system permease protein
MERRTTFDGLLLPAILLLPQLLITAVFFYWPTFKAIWYSFVRQDAFGIQTTFVGFENYLDLFADPNYRDTMWTTVVFSTWVTVLALAVGLLLAALADRQIRGSKAYTTLLVWPYAIAPAIAGVVWLLMFHPQIGLIGRALNNAGFAWDFKLRDGQALFVVIIAAAWNQVAYNFLFFLAGLQAIPNAVLEAASIDGAGPMRRFWTIVLPLLKPTVFFLLVVNIVYALFDTFGVIDALTKGGPGNSTQTMIYRAYLDGRVNLNLGLAGAQSVILMIIVIALTAVQFRVLERRMES